MLSIARLRHLINFKGHFKVKTNSILIIFFSKVNVSEGDSISYKAPPHETNQLDGETATKSKEAQGYQSHKFPVIPPII